MTFLVSNVFGVCVEAMLEQCCCWSNVVVCVEAMLYALTPDMAQSSSTCINVISISVIYDQWCFRCFLAVLAV